MVLKLIFILLITGYAVLADNSQLKHDLRNAKSVKKTIQSEDGDIIDCIDIYKQPAFSHPALKDHKIQMTPSFVPTIDITSRRIEEHCRKRKARVGIPVTKQIWQRNGSCPEGTVPIIRRPQNNKAVSNLLRPNRSMSILITQGFAYLGAQAGLGIFYPRVELDSEYTFTHVTLESGGSDDIEQVRAGWAVNPLVHNDRQTRFSVYWTADGSKNTGCFDSTCPGFVQVSSSIAPGAALDLDPKDVKYWPPAIMSIYIVKDPSTNNWWVQNGGRNVGYFPPDLFGALNHHAATVQWGGEVQSSHINGFHPHTSTDMGSGEYASPEFSALFQNIRVLENSWALKYPESVTPYADEFSCYNYFLDKDHGPDPKFYYGGPGQDPRCP